VINMNGNVLVVFDEADHTCAVLTKIFCFANSQNWTLRYEGGELWEILHAVSGEIQYATIGKLLLNSQGGIRAGKGADGQNCLVRVCGVFDFFGENSGYIVCILTHNKNGGSKNRAAR